ncbi:MAG TPA: DegT/DnrJ/EryC1/StrS family aminotransferase [Kofleriaceae bacterium]|jgi:dTDP-4-amino-4,6-dideoxygalactose transaminase
MIAKVARDAAPHHRPFIAFPSARAAFRAFLAAVDPSRVGVLLPAYIGWSPREGSGVFDPIQELDEPFWFYRVDMNLHVDVDHLVTQLDLHRPRVLLVIHYFGYPDPAYLRVAGLARARGVIILEDEAHAMFTDVVGGVTGRLGAASIVSLHKLLPVETGGGLFVNRDGREVCSALVGPSEPAPWSFDLAALAARRRHNAELLRERLGALRGRVDVLWDLPPNVVPQTLPVAVRVGSRDVLYERMNAAGFGVVSLYHTMIDAITRDEFPISYELARTMMNLPVHQEATDQELERMIDALDRFTR